MTIFMNGLLCTKTSKIIEPLHENNYLSDRNYIQQRMMLPKAFTFKIRDSLAGSFDCQASDVDDTYSVKW